MAKKQSSNQGQDDSLWKDLLERFFVPMIQVVLPEMAEDLDHSRPVEFLNKEMTSLALNTEKNPTPKQYVDMLADVPLLNGENACILLHVEVQGKGGKEDLPTRMNRYRSILEARYHRPIVGLAIITSPIGEKQSKGLYHWKMYGTEVIYRYSVLKAYEGNVEKLSASANPFDLAHLAAIRAWKCRKKGASKLRYLKELVIILRDRVWQEHEKAQLVTFMEGIVRIYDPDNPQEYLEWIAFLEEEKEAGAMYVSLMERKGIKEGKREGIRRDLERGMQRGIKKGRQEGRQEGVIQAVIKMLEKGTDIQTISNLLDLPLEKVKDISDNREKYAAELEMEK